MSGSDKANKLAEKLLGEGEKVQAFLRGLPAEAWTTQIYPNSGLANGDAATTWNFHQLVEHMALSEQNMNRLMRQIIEGGVGAPEGFDIDGFNKEQTGKFAALTPEQLVTLFADTRQRTAAFARELDEAQLAKRGRHPAMGDSSVEDILKMIYLHNTMHLKDVRRVLALAG